MPAHGGCEQRPIVNETLAAALEAALGRRSARPVAKFVRADAASAAVDVLTSRPSRKAQGDAWEQTMQSCVRIPATPPALLPIQALHSKAKVEFVGDCPLAAPHRYTADSGVGLILPPGATPMFAAGARAVPGPTLPFAENLNATRLNAAGHCLLPGSVSSTLLGRLRTEAAQGDLRWSNIFNDVAPWAGRPEDDEGRQVAYSNPESRLEALEEWAAALLAAVSPMPGGEVLRVGTAGYVRTALPTRQHLHRDLPLPAADEEPVLLSCTARPLNSPLCDSLLGYGGQGNGFPLEKKSTQNPVSWDKHSVICSP